MTKAVIKKGILITFFFAVLIIATSYTYGGEKPFTISILPCTDVVMSFKKFNPLITYLREETGYDIKLVVPADSPGFEMAIMNGEIDFAFQDPHTYIKFDTLYNKDALLRSLTMEGETSQFGVLIARKDSLIRKVEDLKGKTVMFGPKQSATKWLAAKLLFEERGLDIDKDLKNYSNGGCCQDIAFNVYLKAVDAGVVCCHFLEEHPEKQQELGIDPKQIMVIAKTKLMPTRVFASRQGIDERVINKVNQALLKLDGKNPAHKKILYSAELGGFQRTEDKDYNSIRMLIDKKTIE